MIKSGQLSFVDPTEGLGEEDKHKHSLMERKKTNELRDASSVILHSLGALHRGAIRAELMNMPDDSKYYEHGDDEDWEHFDVQGDMSKQQDKRQESPQTSSKGELPMRDNYRSDNNEDFFTLKPHPKHTIRSGTMQVEVDSDEEDDILGKVLNTVRRLAERRSEAMAFIFLRLTF